MTVLSNITLNGYNRKLITPWHEQTKAFGMTFGCGPAGYDIRIEGDHSLGPGGFLLAAAKEHFQIPNDIIAFVHDKSTWCRRGIAVQNTVLEPGWKGHLTLEITNHMPQQSFGRDLDNTIHFKDGMPIAQVVFHRLDIATSIPYRGKYQNAGAGPQEAIFEPNEKA